MSPHKAKALAFTLIGPVSSIIRRHQELRKKSRPPDNAQVFFTWFCGHVHNGTQRIPPRPVKVLWAYSYFLAPESGAAVCAHMHITDGGESRPSMALTDSYYPPSEAAQLPSQPVVQTLAPPGSSWLRDSRKGLAP